MIQFVNTILIKTSSDRVFSFLVDPTHLPQWNYYIKDVTLITDKGTEVGARYHQTRKQDEQFFTITAIDPNHFIEFTADDDARLWFKRCFEITSSETNTIVRDTFTLRHSGFIHLFLALAKGRLRRAVYANLLKLKELLEKGSTTLQDGRKVALKINFSFQP